MRVGIHHDQVNSFFLNAGKNWALFGITWDCFLINTSVFRAPFHMCPKDYGKIVLNNIKA